MCSFDLTGETKIISSALTLLATSKGYKLFYTGGKARNKDGLGTVISDSEQFFKQANPWDILAIEELKKAALYANKYQFKAARSALSSAAVRARSPRLRAYFDSLIKLTDAYSQWDLFNHKTAVEALKLGFTSITAYSVLTEDKALTTFVLNVDNNLKFLQAMQQELRGFQDSCSYTIKDLQANASRRAAEDKYDDAVARLYRSPELVEQLQLKQYNINSSNVLPEQIPDAIKEECKRRYNYSWMPLTVFCWC